MKKNITKIDILSFLNKKKGLYINNDPIFELLSNYKDIEIFLKEKDKLHLLTLFCFNAKIIHKILYNDEEIIKIKYDEKSNNLPYNCCLDFLIKENPEMINYIYSFDFINNINNERKKIKDKYKLIIMAKCIVDLIINFKGSDEFVEEETGEILENMEKENREVIRNNIDALNNINTDLNEEKIERKNIYELYIIIIKGLIKNRKFVDYNYTINILNQLDLININITMKLINELCEIFNMNESSIADLLILKEEDLFDEKKIDFYYIFLKFILKNQIYIYLYPNLIKIKKIIIKQLKSNQLTINKNNKDYIEKYEYILKNLLDSQFYWNKYINISYLVRKEKLKEIIKYYKEYLFESKKEDIINIEKNINNYGEYNKICEKYLKDYELAREMNIRAPIINFIYNKKNKLTIKIEEKIKNKVESWKRIERMIKGHKLEKMKRKTQQIILNYFNNENNKDIIMKIFDQKDYDFFINESINLNMTKNLNDKIKNENKKELNKKENKLEKTNKKIENEVPINDNKNKIYENNIFIINNEINININKLQKKEELKDKFISTQDCANNKNYNKSFGNNNIIQNLIAPLPVKIEIKYDDKTIANILNKCIINLYINNKKKVIYGKILFGDKYIEITYEKLNEYKEAYSQIKKENILAKNFISFYEFLKQVEERIKKEFVHNYKLRIKLECIKQNENNNIDSNIFNITCLYTFYNPINNNQHIYREENILINGTNSKYQGFEFLINDINSNIYRNIKYKELNQENQIKSEDNTIKNKSNKNENYQIKNFNIFDNNSTNILTKTASYEKILEFDKIIGKQENPVDYIIELADRQYISGSFDSKPILYDNQYIEKIQIKDFKDSPYKITEK